MPDTSSGRRSYMEGPRSRVSFSDIIGRLANGRIAQGIKSGATLAGDVYQGRVDPTSDEGIARSGDMAGLAMMGSIGGAGGTVNSGIKAFHGSPHSFDKFDMAKIGSGEGAQAYGHGLYFAENEGVAKGYRDTLSKPTVTHPEMGTISKMWDLDTVFIKEAQKAGADELTANKIGTNITEGLNHGDDLDHMRAFARQSDWPQAEKAAWEAALNKAKEFQVTPNKGSMYKVNIDADPSKFLDYDNPLTPDIQNAIAGPYREAMSKKLSGDKQVSDMFGPATPSSVPPPESYGQLETALGREGAAKALREAGIPGIKYKDAGSRGTAEGGTNNYVVFDDRLVSIMKKYGLVGAAGAATAAQIAQELDGKLQANLDAGGA